MDFFRLSTVLCLVFLVTLNSACTKNEDDNNEATGKYDADVLICNEGPFQEGSGSISYLNRTTGVLENGVFETVNSRPLGNIVQSVAVHQGKTYIVVNNANKVEVVDAGSFESVGAIETGIAQPRYFIGLNENKGYLSQWGDVDVDASVAVIDLNTFTVTKTIAVPDGGPEQMVLVNETLWFVVSGGFNSANKVGSFNTTTDELIGYTTVGDSPNSLQKDIDGNLWVLCGGKKIYDPVTWYLDESQSTAGSLCKIETANGAVTMVAFDDITAYPNSLQINADATEMYYLYNGSVVKQATSNLSTINTNALVNGFFYGLGYDAAENYLYASDPLDYASNGYVIRYTTNGTTVDSLNVGVVPNGSFYFYN